MHDPLPLTQHPDSSGPEGRTIEIIIIINTSISIIIIYIIIILNIGKSRLKNDITDANIIITYLWHLYTIRVAFKNISRGDIIYCKKI